MKRGAAGPKFGAPGELPFHGNPGPRFSKAPPAPTPGPMLMVRGPEKKQKKAIGPPARWEFLAHFTCGPPGGITGILAVPERGSGGAFAPVRAVCSQALGGGDQPPEKSFLRGMEPPAQISGGRGSKAYHGRCSRGGGGARFAKEGFPKTLGWGTRFPFSTKGKFLWGRGF